MTDVPPTPFSPALTDEEADAYTNALSRAALYEIREQEGELDEVVATNPTFVHLERMGEAQWWLGITFEDGTELHVNVGAVNPGAKGYGHAEAEEAP